MSKINKKSKPSKKDSNTEELAFWRQKKKIAWGHMKTAKNTGNGGWVNMLKKRIGKYGDKIDQLD
jgi:hypothetical protein